MDRGGQRLMVTDEHGGVAVRCVDFVEHRDAVEEGVINAQYIIESAKQ